MDTAIKLDDERSKGDDLMPQLVKDPEIQRILAKRIIDMGLKERLVNSI